MRVFKVQGGVIQTAGSLGGQTKVSPLIFHGLKLN
jgi:hypothetical protein